MLTFTLTEQQADLVLAALQQRPHFEVNGLINVLLQQASEQQQKAQQAQAQLQTQKQEQLPEPAPEVRAVPQAVNGLDQRV